MNKLSINIIRQIYAFIMFIPFCYFWGISNFTLFSLIAGLYFIPCYLLFDLLFYKK